MHWLDFISNFISHLWPLVILLIVFWFRVELKDVLTALAAGLREVPKRDFKATAAGVTIEMSKAAERVQEISEAPPAPQQQVYIPQVEKLTRSYCVMRMANHESKSAKLGKAKTLDTGCEFLIQAGRRERSSLRTTPVHSSLRLGNRSIGKRSR